MREVEKNRKNFKKYSNKNQKNIGKINVKKMYLQTEMSELQTEMSELQTEMSSEGAFRRLVFGCF